MFQDAHSFDDCIVGSGKNVNFFFSLLLLYWVLITSLGATPMPMSANDSEMNYYDEIREISFTDRSSKNSSATL